MKINLTDCPCQSQKSYEDCCGSLHRGFARATTAEQLMRSRYSAFAKGEIVYLKKTLWPEQQKLFDVKEVSAWARGSKWLGLLIVRTEGGGFFDQNGVVEFKAFYESLGKKETHHEISKFRKGPDGAWYFVQDL